MKGVSTMMMYTNLIPLLSFVFGLIPIALQVVMCVLLYKIGSIINWTDESILILQSNFSF